MLGTTSVLLQVPVSLTVPLTSIEEHSAHGMTLDVEAVLRPLRKPDPASFACKGPGVVVATVFSARTADRFTDAYVTLQVNRRGTLDP